MKNLNITTNECVNELRAIGINPPAFNVTINTRATSRWGLCSKTNGKYSIEIASVLVDDNAPEIALKATLIHEILHTMPKCMNHGEEWESYASKVNKTYGYKIIRTNTYKDKGFTSNPLIEAHPYKYTITCNHCGRKWNYRRASTIIKGCKNNTCTCPCGANDFKVVENY